MVVLQSREGKIPQKQKNMNKIKINYSRQTWSTSASQSTEFDSAEECINLNRPYIASDDIAKILFLNRFNNVDKLHLLQNNFRPVGEVAKAFDF